MDSITEQEWIYKNIKCKVRFVRNSHRCGYMQIPKKSEFKKIGLYNDLPIEVHGGLTYWGKDDWIGFDCAHAGDRTGQFGFSQNDHFWTLEETINETEKMVDSFLSLTWQKIMEHKVEYMPNWFKQRIKIITLKKENQK